MSYLTVPVSDEQAYASAHALKTAREPPAWSLSHLPPTHGTLAGLGASFLAQLLNGSLEVEPTQNMVCFRFARYSWSCGTVSTASLGDTLLKSRRSLFATFSVRADGGKLRFLTLTNKLVMAPVMAVINIGKDVIILRYCMSNSGHHQQSSSSSSSSSPASS